MRFISRLERKQSSYWQQYSVSNSYSEVSQIDRSTIVFRVCPETQTRKNSRPRVQYGGILKSGDGCRCHAGNRNRFRLRSD